MVCVAHPTWLVQACGKYFAIPLWANIQEGLTLFTSSVDRPALPKTTQIVEMAQRAALAMGTEAYLVLDAYFTVRPVFLAAAPKRKKIKSKANCWLRTVTANTPSEFVTRTALAKVLKKNLYDFAKDWITQLIRQKQKPCNNKGVDEKVA